MGRSLVIGRVRGIEIKMHPTFLLVVPWVALNWGYFGGYGAVGIGFGLTLVFLLFTFVVLHELGHSFAALWYGVGVRDITLLPIGGVARIEHLPAEPWREIAIALAGPAVNGGLAIVFAPPVFMMAAHNGLVRPIELLPYLTEVSPFGFILYLFFTNLTLVVFNLLPAFPMDGGRVLRALLCFVTARLTATRVAVWIGEIIGAGLVIFGLIAGTPSLILVAIFVIAAALAEGTAVRVEDTMRKLRVGHFMLWDLGGVGAHHPLSYALRGGPRDVAVVNQDGRVVGMLWRHELMQALNGGMSSRTVSEIMDRRPIITDMDDTIYDVHQRMTASGRWAIAVTENGYYRGIFTSERFWYVYRQIARHPWADFRARMTRLVATWRLRGLRQFNR